jgi:hypothetical protein
MFEKYKPTLHGPAVRLETYTYEMFSKKYDLVPYIHFEGWPKVAKDWASRKRPYNWPSKAMINEVIESGYGVVPVGSGRNRKTNLEWRLSFSLSEKLLFQKMAYGKLVFYYLVKKAFNNMLPKHEIFKSYHVKMLYFWYMENVPDMQFYPQNYGHLMINFIDDILLAIAEKKVNHYFISSVNLIKKHLPQRV